MNSIEHRIEQQARRSISFFRGRVLPMPWTPRGILTSEGFAFCVMASLYRVDAVVESGICNARSTEMWAKYLVPPAVDIVAIDWKITNEARARLSGYGVVLVEGDATEILLSEIEQRPDRRIGVFIDGPKGGEAVALAMDCIKLPQVAFVGVHDMAKLLLGKPHKYREAMEVIGGFEIEHATCVWFTDAQWFVEAYADLDADDSHWDEEQGTKWLPGVRCERDKQPIPLGSYGYTIGFLMKELPE